MSRVGGKIDAFRYQRRVARDVCAWVAAIVEVVELDVAIGEAIDVVVVLVHVRSSLDCIAKTHVRY